MLQGLGEVVMPSVIGVSLAVLHPATLLEVRRAIRGCDLSLLRARVQALLRARDRAGIEKWLQAQG